MRIPLDHAPALLQVGPAGLQGHAHVARAEAAQLLQGEHHHRLSRFPQFFLPGAAAPAIGILRARLGLS